MMGIADQERAAAAPDRPIPGLRGSITHKHSIELHQRHHDAGTGCCVTCGDRHPCAARRHAAEIIAAAGEEPKTLQQVVVTDRYVGYPLGGHGRRADVPYFGYQR